MNDVTKRIALFLAWPWIAAVLLFCVAVVLISAWVLVLFGSIEEKDGHWTIKHPWADK